MYILSDNLQVALNIAIKQREKEEKELGMTNTALTAGFKQVLAALQQGQRVEIK